MSFNLLSNYAVLSSNGNGRSTPGGEAFWAQPLEEMEKVGHDWLVTEHQFTISWDYQEIHPEADEFCYVVEGSVTLRLEAGDGSGQRSVPLSAGSAFLIPLGMWHTAEVAEPVRMIFITMGAGTDVRPNVAGSVA